MNLVEPISREFLCQHRNDDSFSSNLTDFVTYMQGEVIEKLKFIGEYEVQTVVEAGIGVEINAVTDSGSIVKFTHPFENWGQDGGIVVGNTLYIEGNGNNTTGTVTAINGTEMLVSSASFFTTLSTTDGDSRDDYVFRVTTVPTSVQFAFGIVPNSQQNATFASLLNGETQLYVGQGLVISTPQTLSYLANPATDLGSVEVEYTGASGTGNSVFSFTVEHIFRVPHFIEDWLTNYIGGSIPAPFQGSDSYKYVNQLVFGVNLNDPNEWKIFIDNFQLGSIGFVGQNFNIGSPDYSLSSLQIDVSSLIVSEPEVTGTNTFEVTISRASGNFANGEKCYLYITKLPDEAEYTDASNTYEENFVLDQLAVLEGAGTSSSSIIQNYEANKDGGDPSLIDLDFEIAWTAAQQELFQEGDNIFIGVAVENGPGVTATTSDRVLIKIYAGPVTKNNDVTGLITVPQMDIFPAAADTTLATPTSNINGWNNNAWLLSGSFRLTKEADSSNAQIKSARCRTIGRIPSSNIFFLLDDYAFPFSSGFVGVANQDVDGTLYQQFNVDTTREIGNVKSNSDLREVKFKSVIPGSFQNYQEFTWNLGIEIPHRWWLFNQEVQDVAPEFYDALLTNEFFNFNFRSSNYSGQESYEIFVVLTLEIDYIDTDGNTVTTTYHLSSDQCEIGEFDEDLIGTGYSAAWQLYDAAGNPILQPIPGQDCTVEATITHPAGLLADLAGELVIDVQGSSGQTSRLSSTKDYTSGSNILKGTPSNTNNVTVADAATETVVTAVMKGSLIQDETDYKFYVHLVNTA